MAPSISGKVIDRIVNAGVANWFRQAGFERKGRSFFRQHGDLVQTSNLQASKINMPNVATFAVNLGVEWPYWHNVWTGRGLVANPALAPTFIQTRLHPNQGAGRDHWWPAHPDTDPDRIAAEVMGALQAYAETFWTRYSNLEGILREFEANALVPTGAPRRLVHAALLVRAGRTSDAKDVIMEAARRFPRGLSGFQRVSERLGLGNDAA